MPPTSPIEGIDPAENPEAWNAALVAHLLANPPTSLGGLAPVLVGPPAEDYDCEVSWKLVCPCGCERGRLIGPPSEDPHWATLQSPVQFQCAACSRTAEVFDAGKHGYNGEFFGDESGGEEQPPARPYACSKCKGEEFVATAVYQQSDFETFEDEPELAPRAQDYFHWIFVRGVCCKCGELAEIVDHECA